MSGIAIIPPPSPDDLPDVMGEERRAGFEDGYERGYAAGLEAGRARARLEALAGVWDDLAGAVAEFNEHTGRQAA